MSSKTPKSLFLRRHELCSCSPSTKSFEARRFFSSAPARRYHDSSSQSSWRSEQERSVQNEHHKRPGRQRAREKLADKEFFLSLLSSATTKREAKSYLSRFPSAKKKTLPVSEKKDDPTRETEKPGVNLGSFYGATRSVLDTPVFRQSETPERQKVALDESLHVALIKLTNPESLDDETVHGVALTLSQLTRLGLASCVVIDPGSVQDKGRWRVVAEEQASRLSTAIDACDGGSARRLDSALITKDGNLMSPKLLSRQVLLKSLRQNHTVIITPVVYCEQTAKYFPVPANEVILALTREMAGLEIAHDPDEDPSFTAERLSNLQREVTVDRLIVLDPLGGIPAFQGPQRSHVFINMEQEYEDIAKELRQASSSQSVSAGSSADSGKVSPIASSNPFSRFVTSEVVPLPTQDNRTRIQDQGMYGPLQGHLNNLQMLRQTLALLPPSSSGIIATPLDIARSARPPPESVQVSAVGTRRQKNPLIHNLLTDKPSHSSSLPSSRLGSKKESNGKYVPPLIQSTFVKRGMPLTILPNPREAPWTADSSGMPCLTLNDPRIDLPRLVYLIEDSFNRKLDVPNYLKRVNSRIAGLIIAGEYEGGAILTWETPPGIRDDGSPESVARMVPYLDKFAVLKRSQGAGGVADIVFNAMVRSCFPNGVCWRSRIDNPVNKWYFERSRGTWKLPGSNWAMFWTTPAVPEDAQRFRDYEAVCRSIQPNWADHKAVVD